MVPRPPCSSEGKGRVERKVIRQNFLLREGMNSLSIVPFVVLPAANCLAYEYPTD